LARPKIPGPDPATLRSLGARRNGPALLRALIQLAAFGFFAVAAARLGAQGHPTAWLAGALCGLMMIAFFPMMHEAAHGTAFAAHGLNRACTWIGALFMLQAPSFFREFHLAHHRWTQDRERDPEIASLPNLLDAFPRNPAHYLFVASGQPLMVGKFGFTLICALLPYGIWKRFFPFVPEEKKRRVAWESRLAATLLVGAAWIGLESVPGFAYVLLAWPIAHLGLGLYLMSEHTGLANQGSQFERTRSAHSNAAVRWLMWNMPYHAEHHAFPGIPFHALPALHAQCEPKAPHTVPGYGAFHREAMRRSLHLG
jgi:fatty acid desaturase